MLKRLTHHLALATLLAPMSVQAQATPEIRIESSKPGPVISRQLFGQFAEHLGTGIYEGVWVGEKSPIPNVRGIRSDVVIALRNIKVPNVRWPGGCFADTYNWRDGIGDPAKRRIAPAYWGGTENNRFGTHEFFDFVEQIGSEAYISVNVGTGTPREAAEWLEYMTAGTETSLGKERATNGRTAPWKVKYLGIGNESWGCGGKMAPATYVAELNRYSTFLRNYHPAQEGANPFSAAPAGDQMVRIAVGPAGGDTAYTEAVSAAYEDHPYLGANFEGLALHHYTHGAKGIMQDPATGFGEADWAIFLKNAYEIDALIMKHSAVMDRRDPRKKIALVVDEWGNWLQPMPGTRMFGLKQQNSLRDAMTAAITLNAFARHADRVRMANIAQMVNVIQAMILTDGPKMVLTPTYHVFKMYLPFQDATLLPVTLDAGRFVHGKIDLPRVDAIAAKTKDGAVWLSLANLDPGKPVTLGAAGKSATGDVLTADKMDAVNSFTQPETVRPRAVRFGGKGGKVEISLPPKSITVLRLQQ